MITLKWLIIGCFILFKLIYLPFLTNLLTSARDFQPLDNTLYKKKKKNYYFIERQIIDSFSIWNLITIIKC